jgi:hypothetical protein
LPRDQVSYFKDLSIFLRNQRKEKEKRQMDAFMAVQGSIKE